MKHKQCACVGGRGEGVRAHGHMRASVCAGVCVTLLAHTVFFL